MNKRKLTKPEKMLENVLKSKLGVNNEQFSWWQENCCCSEEEAEEQGIIVEPAWLKRARKEGRIKRIW
jgi:hypothetical protein